MLIYSEIDHPRFRYAAEMVLMNYSGSLLFTQSKRDFDQFEGPKICYDHKNELSNSFYVNPIFWNDQLIKPQTKLIPAEEGFHLCFDDRAFDVFAATFFMLSRMEEYQDNTLDQHGRFMSSKSVLHERQAYRMPLVDMWRAVVERKITELFPEIVFRRSSFEIKPTIDVDSAFAYRHKGLKRTFGGFAKDIVQLRWTNAFYRLRCVTGLKQDPYDTYAIATSEAKNHAARIQWFFLLSDLSHENINVSHKSIGLRNLIVDLNQKGEIGIHPGYHRSEHAKHLHEELSRLQSILGRSVKSSRQHYLRMSMPETYRLLIHENITDDYTMGFADDAGYRAGTALPFPWFDLILNKKTTLAIHPFVVMDTTLKNYLQLSPEEAILEIKFFKDQCKKMNLPFEFLWHNESLSEHHSWKEWRKVWNSCF